LIFFHYVVGVHFDCLYFWLLFSTHNSLPYIITLSTKSRHFLNLPNLVFMRYEPLDWVWSNYALAILAWPPCFSLFMSAPDVRIHELKLKTQQERNRHRIALLWLNFVSRLCCAALRRQSLAVGRSPSKGPTKHVEQFAVSA
jgi:hypothetical protein